MHLPGAVALLALSLGGCGNSTDPGTGAAVVVEIDTPLLTLAPGGTFTLHAAVRDASGRLVPGAIVRWSSSDPATLRVSPDGAAEGIGRGGASIVAVVGAAADTVPGLVGIYASLTAGSESTCARTTAGELICWGSLFHTDLPKPQPGGSAVRSIGLGIGFFCTLDATGAPGCPAEPFDNNPPVFDPVDRYEALAAGLFHACGLTQEGAAFCRGQLTPDHAILGEPLTALASGGSNFQCALGASGSAYCWGEGRNGELGDGIFHLPGDDQVSPTAVLGGLRFATIAAGRYHACGLTAAGEVYCWGSGGRGQLGDGLAIDSPVPVRVVGTRVYRQLTAGGDHSCGLGEDGVLDCWGEGAFGEVGDGGTGLDVELRRVTPGAVTGPRRWLQVAAGLLHTCGLADDGNAYCWGFGAHGELGNGQSGWDTNGNGFMTSTPVLVADP